MKIQRWLTARFILVLLMLIGAPAASLAHLLLNWLPESLTVSSLRHETQVISNEFESAAGQLESMQQRLGELRAAAAAVDEAEAAWLPRRDRQGVFERLAQVLRDCDVTVPLFTPGTVGLYAAAARDNLLACETITVECSGDYESLTTLLDRLSEPEVSIRFSHLSWLRRADTLKLTLQLQVPFVPDGALAATLADVAGLEKRP